ncbi:MAG: winged helix-turn-helix transcriptional regulator [Spirochaetales bacterium]|nr:winged helix-turn-helix transcriptional regulator [Spirochaetales bacterium]
MARNLTPAQKNILSFASTYIAEHSTSPSVREIAERFGISSAGAWAHLRALEKKGYIAIESGQARSIRILNEEYRPDTLSKLIPIYDLSKSRYGIAGNSFDEYLKFPSTLLEEKKEYFGIIMEGPDMKNIAIQEGDLLVFERSDELVQSAIVLARPDTGSDEDQTMVRRLERLHSNWTLVPECDSIGSTNCQKVIVYGILALVVRRYER